MYPQLVAAWGRAGDGDMGTGTQGHRDTGPCCPCPHLSVVLCSAPHCRLHKIRQKEQGEALAAALADSLWAAGDGRRAAVCILTAATHCSPPAGYKADSFTERVGMEMLPANMVLKRHLFRDEGSHGLILFLYSLLFSRTLKRVREELGATAPQLLECSSGNVTCTQVGSAQFANVPIIAMTDGRFRKAPHLFVGSMLKTPKFPIWLCSINGTHSVLFSTNRLLLSDWKMEHIFHLYFYTGQCRQTRTAHLTIDTHSHHWEEGRSEAASSPGRRAPSLEMAIRTKWPGAAVGWNGTQPFF
uniref:MINDY family member 4B n=1 Tax=Meleagris gallopavo TaxID=9103 RepID=A0A803YMM4_MELGA